MTDYPLVPPEAGREKYSPLETVIRSALRLAGNFSPNRVSGEVMMMLIEFANETLEDVRDHEYWDGTPIDDYISQTEVRPVHDRIIQHGILARYYLQQSSSKAETAWRKYQKVLNQRLYIRKYGANQQHFLVPHDKEPLK